MPRNLNTLIFIAVTALITAVTAQAETPQVTAKKVEIQCGQYKVAISCGKVFNKENPDDERQCNHNTLSFTSPDGKAFIPASPKGFDETKTPTSFSCIQGNDGRYYVEVEFNNGWGGNEALTFHLFEPNGRRLSADQTHLMVQYENARKKYGITKFGKWINIEGDRK